MPHKTDCPYCGQPASLVSGRQVYPRRSQLRDRKYWSCEPCGAHVGCHTKGSPVFRKGTVIVSDGTYPLGTLANAALRAIRQQVHEAFDPLWSNDASLDDKGKNARTRAYSWLASVMNLPTADCHIGMFDEEQCRLAIRRCKEEALFGIRNT